MATVYDVIVVGAGVEGSGAAYNSAMDGYSTLLIEQFPLPHTRGSSHGQSRTIRMAYNKLFYSQMMVTAYKMWETLEKQEGVQLYRQAGGLTIGTTDSKEVADTAAVLAEIGVPHERLDSVALAQRFPQFRLSSDHHAVYDRATGVLMASKALECLWNQFKKRGGLIRDGEPVTKIIPGDIVMVETAERQYRARSVIICAGPWTSRLVEPLGLNLPLKSQRVGVYHWKAKSDVFRLDRGMPNCFVTETLNGKTFDLFGLPCLEYPEYFKFCAHLGVDVDPEDRDSYKVLEANKKIKDTVQVFVKKYFPQLHPEPTLEESCMFTMTPDEDFILDSHPQWKNVIIGAGFSGHGFKLAPVVGKVLVELATGRKPSFDLKPFEISRFELQAKL